LMRTDKPAMGSSVKTGGTIQPIIIYHHTIVHITVQIAGDEIRNGVRFIHSHLSRRVLQLIRSDTSVADTFLAIEEDAELSLKFLLAEIESAST